MPNALRRTLCVAAPIGIALIFGTAAADDLLDPSLTGTWVGTGQQGEHSWPMKVTFGDDHAKVEYPSLGCGGRWEPQTDSNVPGVVGQFNEKLEYGHDGCIDDGAVRIRAAPDGLNFDWAPAVGAQVEATAKLRQLD